MKKRSKAVEEDNEDVDIIDVDVEEYDEDDAYADGEVAAAAEQAAIEDEEDVDDDGEFNDDDLALPKGARKTFAVPKRRAAKKMTGLGEEDEDELFPLGDYATMPLLPDHEKRPLWITEEGHLFFEMFQGASFYDFVITVAEPIFRPFLIHEVILAIWFLISTYSFCSII